MSEKRIKLEQVATDAVQRSGFHNLSFRTLADEVGVKSSSVHYYFPEKSHLASALIENYTVAFCERLDNINRLNSELHQKLEAFINIFEEVIQEKKFCLCGMMAAEVAILNDDNRERLGKYFRKIEDWLCNAFEQNKEHITSELAPAVLAKIVLSGLEGAILIDRIEGSCDRLDAQRDLILGLVADV